MSQILDKLLGRDHDSQSHSSSTKTETHTSVDTGSRATDEKHHNADGQTIASHTVQHEGVNIKSSVSSDLKSTVSIENQNRINELVTKLGSTHKQIDEYSKKQTAKIDEQIQRDIDAVVTRTQTRQAELLRKANEHTTQIDTEYRAQLQKMVEEIDAAKAKRIAAIEIELNNHQAEILEAARKEIDELNNKASNLKITALMDAQSKAATDAEALTAQAANLGSAATVHQAKGTTTIKTEVSGAATTTTAGAATANSSCSSGSCSTATSKEACMSSGAKTCSDSHKTESTQHQSSTRKH